MALGRSHPLTVEGDDLGMFDLSFCLRRAGRDFVLTYSEQRRGRPASAGGAQRRRDHRSLGRSVPLKVVSLTPGQAGRWSSIRFATGRVPVELLQSFAERTAAR